MLLRTFRKAFHVQRRLDSKYSIRSWDKMQSTAASIAAAAISGADLGAKANTAKGSDATAKKNSTQAGFDAKEAETWMQGRWKALHANVGDSRVAAARKYAAIREACLQMVSLQRAALMLNSGCPDLPLRCQSLLHDREARGLQASTWYRGFRLGS